MPATIQRGDEGADVGLLQRVLKDLRYYDGKVDRDFGEITETALKAYQADAGLLGVENGVCGDATWASLQGQFGDLEGLRTDESTERFVGSSYGIWNSCYATAEERLAAMEAAANTELAAVGVPHVEFQFDSARTRGNAVFKHSLWVAGVSRDWFEPSVAESLSEDDQREIVDTVYHEARHAEQWFNVLRIMAGLNELHADGTYLAPDGNRYQCGVHAGAVAAAVADPLLVCTRTNGPAFDWYENIFGAGGDNRNAVLTSLSDPDPANRRHDEYRTGMPEEADSWDTGGNVQREYRNYGAGGAAHARPVLRRGDMNSAEVQYLQQLLQWRGYYVGYKIDGDFGEHTEDAVKSLQQDARVAGDASGVVGAATWEALIP